MKLWNEKKLDLYTDLLYGEGLPHFEAREIARCKNKSVPSHCPKCGSELESSRGYVGETVLYCPEGHGICWEDSEDAIRRVI